MSSLNQLESAMRSGAATLAAVADGARELLAATDRAALARHMARTDDDMGRRSLRVGLLPLAGLDPAALAKALLGARLIPPDHARVRGPRIRVRSADHADLRAAGAIGDAWTWSDAHPDPRPTIQARATALNAERQALTEEDQTLEREREHAQSRVSQLQQDVIGLSASVNEARAHVRRATEADDQARVRHDRATAQLDAALAELPPPLRREGLGGLRGLTASVLSGFHTEALDRVQSLRAGVQLTARACHTTASERHDAEARLRDAETRLQGHNAQLSRWRAQLAEAVERRDRLRARAGQLTRARVGLARKLDRVEGVRRKSFREALAAQCAEGAQRLWLDWPTPNLPPQTTLLLADGVSASDAALRQRAESWLADRADVLLVAIDVSRPLAPPERSRLRTLLREVPLLLPILTGIERVADQAEAQGHLDADEAVEDARALAVRRLARDVGMPAPPRAVGLALEGIFDKRRDKAERQRLATAFTRELTAVLVSLRDGPRVARPARLAHALRSTARALEEAMSAEDAAEAERHQAIVAQRLQNSTAFRADARRAATSAGPRLAEAALAAAHAAATARIHARFDGARTAVDTAAAAGARALRQLHGALPAELETGIAADMDAVETALQEAIEKAQSDLLADILGPLADRVREAAMATLPGTEDPGSSSSALATDMAELLRARSPEAPTGELRYALIGGALGAVLTGGIAGPLLMALGAGALAGRLGADTSREQQELHQWLDQAQAALTTEVHQRLEDRRDDLLRLGPSTAVAEVMAAIDRFEQWMDELLRSEAERQTERAAARSALRGLRNRLLVQAAELETILETARAPGVVWRAPWVTELPPPPARS